MIKRSALATSAIAAALLVPAGAQAGVMTTNKPCYVEGEQVVLTGAGFPANDNVTVSGTNIFETGFVPASGGFQFGFPAAIQPDNRTAAVSTETVNVTDVTSPAQNTAATYQLVNFTADFGTSFKSAKAKRKWSFSGFPVGLPVYGHFRKGGKKVVDYKFGVAPAPCGQFTKRAPGVPKKKAKFGKYTLQLDNSKKYSAATRPAYRASFKVIKIYK